MNSIFSCITEHTVFVSLEVVKTELRQAVQQATAVILDINTDHTVSRVFYYKRLSTYWVVTPRL